MIKRTLSTLVLWTAVFAIVGFFGATGGVILLAVFSTLAQYEMQVLLEKAGWPNWRIAPLALGFLSVLEAGLRFLRDDYILWIFTAAVGAGGCACLVHRANFRRFLGTLIALIYVPGLMTFYALMPRYFGGAIARGEGLGLVIWIIAIAKFTDVGGYVVGSLVGRHKLAPSISPGKTWEGAVGGLVFAALVAALGLHFAPQFLPGWLTIQKSVLLALPVGVVAIISDLSESVVKRRAGVKDSGRCIPGIGGALDLADSLLLTAPAAFFLLWSLKPV